MKLRSSKHNDTGKMAAFQEREVTNVHCVGCGSDIASRPADRRNLQSSASGHVITAWKTLLEYIVDQEGSEIDVDNIVSGGEDPVRGGRMCRKCFSAYERYQTLQRSLMSNLKKALDVLPSASTSVAKRLRVASQSATSAPLPPLQPGSSSMPVSPDVAVSFCRCSTCFFH